MDAGVLANRYTRENRGAQADGLLPAHDVQTAAGESCAQLQAQPRARAAARDLDVREVSNRLCEGFGHDGEFARQSFQDALVDLAAVRPRMKA